MAPPPKDSKRIEEAQKLSKTEPAKAEAIYEEILSTGPGSSEAALREYETALMGLGELYRDAKRPKDLANLVTKSRSTLSSFAKAKTAKLGQYISPLQCIATLTTLCQFANSSISSLLCPIQLKCKFQLQNHA